MLQREVEAAELRRGDGAMGEEKMFLRSLSDLAVCPCGWEEWWWVERHGYAHLSVPRMPHLPLPLL